MTVPVLYVGGSGRSGTTLIERVIGQLSGFVSVGEIRDLWFTGARSERLCGCGMRFTECPFWREVGSVAFGGWDAFDACTGPVRSVGYRRAVGPILRGARMRLAPATIGLVEQLYGAIARVSGGATIIDSSKSSTYAALLGGVPSVDLRLLHVVRDSRGVAHSWAKRVERSDSAVAGVEMPRIGPAAVAARWLAHNTLLELLGRRVPSSRLRYEDFLDQPRAQLRRSLSELGMPLEDDALAFVGEDSVWLQQNHTASGNPMRTARGEVPLRRDDAWHTALPGRQRLIVTGLTWPMMVRYGYRPF